MFDSSPSLAPGKGLAAFGYQAMNTWCRAQPTARPTPRALVVRTPTDALKFSGLVLAEAMHGSGAAHMFEFTSIYLMSSGHAAVEILTTPPAQFVALNEPRYRAMKSTARRPARSWRRWARWSAAGACCPGRCGRWCSAGTSMTAGVLINYLPAHMVYRTPKMERIFDGFLPMSNGAMVRDVDVPMIHVPTMHEVSGNITNKQDSDEPGKQYRLYEFSGMGHIDTRDSVRMKPNPCALPLSTFPVQAYMSVALDHLLAWVDKGTVPPRAERILVDRNEANDGSQMALDEHGNPRAGIRTTYVDVPTAKFTIRPAAAATIPANASAYITRGGQQAANQMCGLSTSQVAIRAGQAEGHVQEQAGVREGGGEAVDGARKGRLVAAALPVDDSGRCGQGELLGLRAPGYGHGRETKWNLSSTRWSRASNAAQ